MIINLNGEWLLSGEKIEELKVIVPGSVITALLDNKVIENPYFGLNEEKTRSYLKSDYTFRKIFSLKLDELKRYNYLCLEGVDTIAEIFLNGVFIAKSQDFHVFSKILLDNSLLKRENILEIKFTSNYRYIEEYDDRGLFKTYSETDPKSIVERKPNYMFGWDWAPNLADMGITGGVSILSTNEGYLNAYRYEYEFVKDNQLSLEITTEFVKHSDSDIKVTLSFDDKLIAEKQTKLQKENKFSLVVDNPVLWYPNGSGEQALYDLTISTKENEYRYKIGFKKLDFDFAPTKEGRNFAVSINNIPLFLKGFNVVPEDNILPFIINERTNRLLELAKNTGTNVIRIWGGGYYPSEYFYQRCDELGLLVWQDLMFADAAYNNEDEEFMSLAREEIIQQVKRIRNHPSILLICGNNENETAINGHEEIFKKHFVKMFCQDVKQLVNAQTNLLYLHSSPTNLDPIFYRPNDPNIFDVHYWEVGNGEQDYDMYSTIYPPMLSEFGLWSLPNYQTLKKYISSNEMHLGSSQIESRNKRDGNFERIESNIKKHFKHHDDLAIYIYLNQLYQARAVKYCVEHLRNNMDRCHGAIYWQLNDSWPGISCSLIDYEYGLKALYYYARRFFQNIVVNISSNNDVLNVHVSNLESDLKNYILSVKHMNFAGDILDEKSSKISVKPTYSGVFCSFASPLKEQDEFIYAELIGEDGHVISSNIYQQIEDKDIIYPKATFIVKKIASKTFSVHANEFSKDVFLTTPSGATFSDNYFTLLKGQEVTITCSEEIDEKEITIICINNL